MKKPQAGRRAFAVWNLTAVREGCLPTGNCDELFSNLTDG